MSLRMCENQYNVTPDNENSCQNYKKKHVCFSVNQTHLFDLPLKLKLTIKLTVNIHNNTCATLHYGCLRQTFLNTDEMNIYFGG